MQDNNTSVAFLVALEVRAAGKLRGSGEVTFPASPTPHHPFRLLPRLPCGNRGKPREGFPPFPQGFIALFGTFERTDKNAWK